MMRFGVCAGLDMAEAAARAGWDFIEVSVGTFMPSEPDSVRRYGPGSPVCPSLWRRRTVSSPGTCG